MRQPHTLGLHFADREAYRAWSVAQPAGRYEWVHGNVVAMAPERLIHTRLKATVWLALHQAVQRAGVQCEALADGATVEIGDDTDYEPDAVVNCGERGGTDALAVPSPVIVVEVLSPSTGYRDLGTKLADYFRVPSVQHYLIVFSDCVRVIHHRRGQGGQLLTTLHSKGTIKLNPPGLQFGVEDVYGSVGLDETAK